MKIAKNKKTDTTIALLLALTVAATLIALPVVSAHTPAWNIPTYAYLTVAPNPVGVDQTVTLVYWLDKYPPTAAGIAGDRWRNLKIEVTKPDGTKETLGPWVSDPVGGGWTSYTPDQVGTYTFVFTFPGQVLSLYGPGGLPGSSSVYENDTYVASSATATLEVLQEKIAGPLSFPLPSEYWTRPIEGQNTDWYAIASNWLAGSHIIGKFQPDGTAPDSPHVMWTKPLLFGGVIGGTNTGINGMTFYDGSQYENKFMDPIIMYGRLYYTLPRSDASSGGGYICVDLRTGETIWWQNYTTPRPSFGQFYDYESMNQHGIIPNGYLWATTTTAGVTTWMAFDPLDGNWLFNETNVPSGTTVYGPNGEILIYQLNAAGKWLAVWNNTAEQQGLHGAIGTSSSAYQWRPIGKSVNMSKAYSWNITVPWLPSGATIVRVVHDDILLGRNGSLPSISSWTPYTMWAMSLKPNSRGSLLWMKNYDAPPGNLTRSQGPVDLQARVFTMWDKETIQWTGYDLDTGEKLWGPTPSENPWNFHGGAGGALMTNTVAYGKLYSTGYSGIVYCYDLENGKLLWNYTAAAGFDTPYGGYPLGIAGVADGKLYLNTNEHSSGAPYWKGAKLRCLNATTGEELWTIYTHGASSYGLYGYAIADGYLVFLNVYDNRIYCIGKGPSATTVEAPMTAITVGESLVLRGSVIDISAGTKQHEQAARFPNGVPAVSDESMGKWMEYVYMQKPFPKDTTGVEVSLDTIDPNNNFVHIATVTSDASGLFSYMWKPEIPGKYTIIATFAGSKSYWGSYAETAMCVVEAPPATPPPAQLVLPPIETYILYATIAIIIAIAVVGILLFRKK